jgi:hypothetical protein
LIVSLNLKELVDYTLHLGVAISLNLHEYYVYL